MSVIRLHLDAHVHLYPRHDVSRLLLAALDHMPRLAPSDLRVLMLAERADCDWFQRLAQDEIRLPGDRWRIVAWDPDGGVKIRHLPDHRDLWILAGRQTATAERLEICSLFSESPIEDGLSARDTVRAILAAGGLPALNWAPGKWMFKRGALVRNLVREFPPEQLILIDTSLRCAGWPAPRLYSRARRQGRPVLAGSDPLPPAGEESMAGRYYCTLSIPAPADPSRLAAPLKSALVAEPLAVAYDGQRNSPLGLARRLRRHRRESRAREAAGASAHPGISA
ncbi:MAG TPA: hypothetical protein PLJ99_01480 [Kiritimatiellia bacterium]|nr:hypothetical protein [Kiritimatiellia bacterium]HPJ56401.1 hypothetical protein [Kiritimatiellia bacterium]HPR67943.1 hypothetical protein [Kiritimatiellia bacterium]